MLNYLCLAVVGSQICEIPEEFEIKVIPGHQSWCQSKQICDFLLVSNFAPFRDIDALKLENGVFSCFPHPPLFDAPARVSPLVTRKLEDFATVW